MSSPLPKPPIERWHPPLACCDPIWEDAYQRFETPQEEIEKFRKRLLSLGAAEWPRESKILEIFCGRGNGLKAWASLGFTNVSGVDLSESLLKAYDGPAQLYLGDCRELKLPDSSFDIIVVQGGLHHLPDLPGDVEKTLAEVQRVLRKNGRFVVVEPWITPFLQFVHAVSDVALARRLWTKIDALAIMRERERVTYENWLGRPEEILNLLNARFDADISEMAWGKLKFVGRPKK